MASWDEPRCDRLREMWKDGLQATAIAKELRSSPGAVYAKAREIGLPGRKRGKRAAASHVGAPSGHRTTLQPWHPAIEDGRTIHGRTVIPARRAKRILKDAVNSSKIGPRVTKGSWKHYRLYTLTLEERRTCPRSCLLWETCYGNNLGHTTVERITDDGYLMPRLHAELAHLTAKHPKGVGVRLHVLGDFYSAEYVQFWGRMLEEFDNLRVFGFTARTVNDDIGLAVVDMMERYDDRAMIRFSGAGLPQLSSEVVKDPADARFIICPGEQAAERTCGNCALCMNSDVSITFLEH